MMRPLVEFLKWRDSMCVRFLKSYPLGCRMYVGFALTGRHATTPCASCHASGYAGTPTACVSCHQADYNGTNDPNHATAGFSTACEACHNTTGWSGANFNHGATRFALTGAHTTTPCAWESRARASFGGSGRSVSILRDMA